MQTRVDCFARRGFVLRSAQHGVRFAGRRNVKKATSSRGHGRSLRPSGFRALHAAALDIIDTELDSINTTRAFADLEERVLHTCRRFCNCGILSPSLLVAIHARRHLRLRKNETARNRNAASAATGQDVRPRGLVAQPAVGRVLVLVDGIPLKGAAPCITEIGAGPPCPFCRCVAAAAASGVPCPYRQGHCGLSLMPKGSAVWLQGHV
jgi:hypothetical protein